MNPKGRVQRVWNSFDDRSHVLFDEDGSAVVTFEEDEPTETTTEVFNRPQYDFKVVGGLLFAVSSPMLMVLLKQHRSLTGKTFKISRTGHGFNVTYQVEELDGGDHNE